MENIGTCITLNFFNLKIDFETILCLIQLITSPFWMKGLFSVYMSVGTIMIFTIFIVLFFLSREHRVPTPTMTTASILWTLEKDLKILSEMEVSLTLNAV